MLIALANKMKKIYFLILILSFKTLAATGTPIIVELGEDYILKGATTKIWIENAKILTAEAAAGAVRLKSVTVGSTLIRQNNQVYRVMVVPVNAKKIYQEWQINSQKFIDLTVDFCENSVCLKGKIFRFQDYKRIVDLIGKNQSFVYLSLELDESLKDQVNAYIENYIRSYGLTPLKVIYAQPWRLNYSTKESAADYKMVLDKLGIMVMENKQKIEIADNVRVEIQVTEIKKDFGQTMGLKWPSQYQAQIMDGQMALPGQFAGMLNAQENKGQIKILATPNLVCRSGKEAEFFAGGEFPIKVLNFKFQDIIWKKYGIIMKVKPTVDAAGQISLQLESEVSSIDPSRTVDGIPGLHTNRVSSHFDLIKSKTIALSGLIKNESSASSDGLPFLSRLPILGSLFSSKEFKENKSELVIFVTPQLVKNE